MYSHKALISILASLALTLATVGTAYAGAGPVFGDGIAVVDVGTPLQILVNPRVAPTFLENILGSEDTDQVVFGDWDGDGTDSVGLFRASGNAGVWIVDYDGTGQDIRTSVFGAGTDTAVPGNWNPATAGDEFGVTRPANGGSAKLWIVDGPGTGLNFSWFGAGNDDEAVGNWNSDAGDGDEPGVTRDSGSALLWITTGSGGLDYQWFGGAGDDTVPGDYTGDGNTNRGARIDTTDTFALETSPISYLNLGSPIDDAVSPGNYPGEATP